MTSIKYLTTALAFSLLGCGGREFACPVNVEIISQDHSVRMAYLEAMDWINTTTGEFVFTIGPGDIRAFGWNQPGAQARNEHDLAFVSSGSARIMRNFAAHELLHLLGIDHDEISNSLMNPFIGEDNDIQPQHIEHIYDYCGY